MISSRPPRKPDLFVVMLMAVVIGMSATLAYQVNLYFNDGELSLTRHAQYLPPSIDG